MTQLCASRHCEMPQALLHGAQSDLHDTILNMMTVMLTHCVWRHKGELQCRSQQGSSGVQTVRMNPNTLKAGTYFFAFFNVDYFVHQPYQYVFLVSTHIMVTPLHAYAACG